MKKATCSVSGNLGTLDNAIYDSQLEIEWLINDVPHIKDASSLDEFEQEILEATNRLAARIFALNVQESLDKNEIRDEEKKVIGSVPRHYLVVGLLFLWMEAVCGYGKRSGGQS